MPLRPHPNLRACKMGPSLNDKYMWQKQFLTYKKLKLYHIFHCTVFILNRYLLEINYIQIHVYFLKIQFLFKIDKLILGILFYKCIKFDMIL